ncbi:hypothetical protein CAAN3_21S01442 [[Candida] anglica]
MQYSILIVFVLSIDSTTLSCYLSFLPTLPYPYTFIYTMLRRPATTIKLTPEDILEYDDALSRNSQSAPYNEQSSHNEEQEHTILKFKDLPDVSVTRDERIGSTARQ